MKQCQIKVGGSELKKAVYQNEWLLPLTKLATVFIFKASGKKTHIDNYNYMCNSECKWIRKAILANRIIYFKFVKWNENNCWVFEITDNEKVVRKVIK